MKLALLCNCYENYTLGKDDPNDKFNDMDSRKTINRIRDVLDVGYEVDVIEASPEAFNKLQNGNYDIVFNFSEGIEGANRELYFPAILEMLKIPFTGSDALTMGITFNKELTKKLLIYHGISTPLSFVVDEWDKIQVDNASFGLPWIIKPVHEGSSMGMTKENIVDKEGDAEKKINELLKRYNQPVLVEEFISGREFTVGIIGNSSLEILPIVEIRDKGDKEGYNWIWDKSKESTSYFDCPKLPDELLNKIKELSIKTYRALNCLDWARIDFRMDQNGRLYVIEANGVSGLSDRSAIPFAVEKSGMSFDDFMNKIILTALERYGIEKPKNKI